MNLPKNPKITLIMASSILLLISGVIEDFSEKQASAPFDSATAFMLFALGCAGIAYGLITFKD